MDSNSIKIVEGEIHKDYRGEIVSINNFSFEGITRTYILHHPDTTVIRGWHGHKYERKWFFCHHGAFILKLVAIDNWETPSKDLEVVTLRLTADKSEMVCVPAGYATTQQALVPNSILQVYSDKTFDEAIAEKDSYRYEPAYFD